VRSLRTEYGVNFYQVIALYVECSLYYRETLSPTFYASPDVHGSKEANNHNRIHPSLTTYRLVHIFSNEINILYLYKLRFELLNYVY